MPCIDSSSCIFSLPRSAIPSTNCLLCLCSFPFPIFMDMRFCSGGYESLTHTRPLLFFSHSDRKSIAHAHDFSFTASFFSSFLNFFTIFILSSSGIVCVSTRGLALWYLKLRKPLRPASSFLFSSLFTHFLFFVRPARDPRGVSFFLILFVNDNSPFDAMVVSLFFGTHYQLICVCLMAFSFNIFFSFACTEGKSVYSFTDADTVSCILEKRAHR